MLPLLGLRIQAGPIELRGVTDDLIGPLCDLAARGVHEPGTMPFSLPWTEVPAEEFQRNYARHHWEARASFSPEKWSAEFAVFRDGELVGVQGVTAQGYAVLRTGETGSWLGLAFQGQGIGTAMRQTLCAFLFDHLDADHITSGAFTDNPASLAVSRKVGYAENGWSRVDRQGKPATLVNLVLERENFVRGGHALTVEGLPEFRRSVGLDGGLHDAVDPVHVAAVHVQRRVMLADRVLVRAFQQAVDLAVGVVEQFDLADAELVGLPGPGPLGDLLDGFRRQFQVVVEIHESGHRRPPPGRALPLTVRPKRIDVHRHRPGNSASSPAAAKARR